MSAYELHKAAQDASRCGMYELATRLFMEAADHALTPEGKVVLLEKALDTAWRADVPVTVQ